MAGGRNIFSFFVIIASLCSIIMEESESWKMRTGVWIAAMVIVAGISFIVGMFIFKEIGYDEGVRFAVTSGSKQGYAIGFEMGYQMRDSLAKKERSLRDADMFNLNLIEQEAGTPADKILLSGTVIENEMPKVGMKKSVSLRIISTAQFARYRELVLQVKLLDRRNNVLKEMTIKPKDILYPGKTVVYEIPYREVPEFTELVNIQLVSADGID